jgi:hypothetical protein
MWTHILSIIPKGLLYEKFFILKLNGVGWGGGNPNFCLNPFVIVLTFKLSFSYNIIYHIFAHMQLNYHHLIIYQVIVVTMTYDRFGQSPSSLNGDWKCKLK